MSTRGYLHVDRPGSGSLHLPPRLGGRPERVSVRRDLDVGWYSVWFDTHAATGTRHVFLGSKGPKPIDPAKEAARLRQMAELNTGSAYTSKPGSPAHWAGQRMSSASKKSAKHQAEHFAKVLNAAARASVSPNPPKRNSRRPKRTSRR